MSASELIGSCTSYWRGERGEGSATERIARVTGVKTYTGTSEDKNRGQLEDWMRMAARTRTKVQ